MECHFPALGLVPVGSGSGQRPDTQKVAVIGINPPEEVTPPETLIRGEKKNGIGLWRQDLYGVNTDLVSKRVQRNWYPGIEDELFSSLGLEKVVLDLLRYDGGNRCNKWFSRRESLPWYGVMNPS
jgi:hypothetical protein